jgi:hypothetical protein
LRLDNFAILLYLVDINDSEVKECFQNHIGAKRRNQGIESNFIEILEEKTEETY